MRGVWIEIQRLCKLVCCLSSLPMRGVWIEIKWMKEEMKSKAVTPHAGSVD